MMNQTCIAAIVLFFAAATDLVAQPPRKDEHVAWRPQRNVKDAIREEIARFEKNLKSQLGPETLAFTPYVAEANNPCGATLEAVTIEQILDSHFQSLRKEADRDNQTLLPTFKGWRRAPVATGSDLLSAPVMGPNPEWREGNITFKLEWNKVDGRFVSQWERNDVDEVYAVELNATLTLGIFLSLRNDRKLTVVSHSITKPLVTGWRASLIASEGEVQAILNTKEPAK
jgi:hypothetical protein